MDRTPYGHFMSTSALVLRGIVDPEVMESIACKEGMALAADLRADSFRLANDCLNVVKSIRQGDLGIYGQIIQEINARKVAFSSVVFVHEHRGSNTDAHRIARSSIHAEVGQHVWSLNPPDGVCNMCNPPI
jgi:alkylated DNA nucleotide flippase Atl1